MGLTKYRSVEELSLDQQVRQPRSLAVALELSEVCGWLSRRRLPAGLHRFGTIEEENRQMADWAGERR